jgi:hypothetical protein
MYQGLTGMITQTNFGLKPVMNAGMKLQVNYFDRLGD